MVDAAAAPAPVPIHAHALIRPTPDVDVHPRATLVDWAQASKIGYSLLLSPLVGFCAAALLLLALKLVARSPELCSEVHYCRRREP